MYENNSVAYIDVDNGKKFKNIIFYIFKKINIKKI